MTHSAMESRAAGGKLPQSQVEAFRRDGYTLVPGAVPRDQIAGNRDRLAQIFATPPEPKRGDTQGVRSDIIARHRWLAELLFSDSVLASLKSLVGDKLVVLPENSITDSQFGGWHTDTTSAELAGETFRTAPDFKVVNAAIYFQENGKYGGGLDVVPGSHLREDVFLKDVQQKYDTFGKTRLRRALKAKIRALIPDFLMDFRRSAADKRATPLQTQSSQPGQITVSQRPGDLLVFDLRLAHKATWPAVPAPHPVETRKFSFFAICGADNETTRSYCSYLKKRSETQQAYAYLVGHKYPDWLLERARAAGVTLL